MTAAEVAARIREAILIGDLVPNQRLVEADLAESYSASRGHVRSALAELTVEGLVERIQNRGARVRAVSLEEALEMVEVRGAVEALCAAKAAARITDDEAAELRVIGHRMEAAVRGGDPAGYAQANQDLHSAVIGLAGQRTAAATVDRLRGQSVRYQYRLSAKPGRPQESLPEHLAIIEAVCSKDTDAAAEAMRTHLESVGKAIRVSVES